LRRIAVVSSIVLAPLAILACASILGIQDGKLLPDASPEGAAQDVIQSKDVLVIDGNFAMCDGEAMRTLQPGVFVDANKGTDDGVCGTISAPCKTITFALGKTDTNHKFVYVAPGSYTESITLKSDVTVQGGWVIDDGGWTPVCATDKVTLNADQPGAAITADNVQNAGVGYMTVSTFHDGVPGGSLYGVLAVDSTLELVNVVIVSQNGGDGTQGDPGSAGGQNCPGSGGNGGPGNPGMAGTGGLSAQGYQPSNGAYGDPGNEGQMGQAGGMGACNSNCVSCTMMNIFNFDVIDTEGGCAKLGGQMVCGDQGSSGCAGTGGNGGGPGLGGGASVAVYAWGGGTVVTIRGGLLATALGGNGGDGGLGGTGGAPSAGSVGMSQPCSLDCDMSCMQTNTIYLEGGTAGAAGTKGGLGGFGGGGAGGPTYLIVKGGGAQVNGANGGMLGKPGVGGTPNGGAGEATPTKVTP
jgi:hypothetical protein